MTAAEEKPLEWKRLWVSIGYVLVINVLVFALAPLSDSPTIWIPNGDKIAHALAFLVLMVWFSGLIPVNRYPQLFVSLLAYGVAIEGLQFLSGYRTMDPADLVADTIGLVIGWLLALCGLGDWCRSVELRLRGSESRDGASVHG